MQFQLHFLAPEEVGTRGDFIFDAADIASGGTNFFANTNESLPSFIKFSLVTRKSPHLEFEVEFHPFLLENPAGQEENVRSADG